VGAEALEPRGGSAVLARGAEDLEDLEEEAVDRAVEGRGDGVRRGHEGLKWAPAALGGGRGPTVGSVAPHHERRGQWNLGCHGRQRPDLDAQGEPSAAGVVATICFSLSLEVGFCRWGSSSLLESVQGCVWCSFAPRRFSFVL
jgi:hypothetical protein